MDDGISFRVGDAVSSALAQADPALGAVICRIGEVSLPSVPEPFAVLAETVLRQQLSESAARAIVGRVRHDIGLTPSAIAAASDSALRAAGVSARKAGYLRGIARAALAGELDLRALEELDDTAATEWLTKVPGIGRWSAQTFLLFGLHRPDVVVLDDLGVRTAAGRMLGSDRALSAEELEAVSERWRPHRTAATLYLYNDRLRAHTDGGTT